MARFSDITFQYDMREDHCQTFCSGFKSNIQRTMFTRSYHVDFIEQAFHLVLELNLSFVQIFTLLSFFKCVEHRNYDYECPLKILHMDNVLTNDVNDSSVVENVNVSNDNSSIIDDISLKFSTPILDEVHIPSEGTNDIADGTSILDDIYFHENDTGAFEYVVMESRMFVQVARYSLATSMIEEENEYEIAFTSVSKQLESPIEFCQIHTYFINKEKKPSNLDSILK